jgi:hypothetical protein
MKIAIGTCLPAKRYMQINSCQFVVFCKLLAALYQKGAMSNELEAITHDPRFFMQNHETSK